MTGIELQLRLAEHVISFLPADEKQKIEMARASLRKMIELDPKRHENGHLNDRSRMSASVC